MIGQQNMSTNWIIMNMNSHMPVHSPHTLTLFLIQIDQIKT